MSGYPIPTQLSRGQLTGWSCVTCSGLADDDAVLVGVRQGRKVFACSGCHREVTGTAVCAGCDVRVDVSELEPGPSGDEACSDCRGTWADLDDGRAWHEWAYAA